MPSLSSYTSPMTARQAAHLLRRCSFGPTNGEIDTFTGLSPQQALDLLVQDLTAPEPPIDPVWGEPWLTRPDLEDEERSSEEDRQRYTLAWWIDQMLQTGPHLRERMTYFFHTHFTTILSRVRQSRAHYYQLALFRHHALGNIKELARLMCLDNAMLVHLDGFDNRKGSPNENFGREFLELYTIGKGPQIGPDDYTTFTELDVREASRVLSGYNTDHNYTTIDEETGIPTGRLRGNGTIASDHDAGTKTFSAAFGNAQISPATVVNNQTTKEDALQELQDLVDMIFAQQDTARHFCRKLYRFFVYYQIPDDVEADIIEPLSQIMIDNEYAVEPVLRALLGSEHFFDVDNAVAEDNHRGAIIKSPLELTLGTLRYFGVSHPDIQATPEAAYDTLIEGVLRPMDLMGLTLYEPFEVAGYAAYHQTPGYNRNWISSNYLARRYQYADLLTADESPLPFDIVAWVDDAAHIANPADAESMVRQLCDQLFPEIITAERFDYFLYTVLLDQFSLLNWEMEWDDYKSTGDDTGVRPQLERLYRALIQAPEYQLF